MKSGEVYALEEEQKQIQWESKFSGREKEDYKRINSLLEQSNYGEILRLYQEECYGGFYSGRNAFVSMNLAIKIYRYDKEQDNHVFWNVKCIEDLDEKLRKLKFLIWRAEYIGCEEIEEALLQYMIEYRPSDWLLKYMISGTALDEKKVIFSFAGLFLKWHMDMYADSLVSFLEKR